MKILVTGGAGYIGSVLCEELARKGFEFTVVDNFQYKQWSLAHLCHYKKMHIERMDVRDPALLNLAKNFDVIIPLAGIVGAPACKQDPMAAKTINLDAQVGLLKSLSASQWVLMPTTNSAYGTTPKGSITDENGPLNPLTEYAIHKVEVEKFLMNRENSISFRLATVFGASARMRLDLLVNDFTYRAYKDKFIALSEAHFRRNFLHVRDASGLFLHGMENFSQMRGNIFNAGLSEANLTKRELCEKIKKYIPDFHFVELEQREDPDKRDYEVSNKKIEKTGWKTEVSLDFGIQELIKTYQMVGGNIFSNI